MNKVASVLHFIILDKWQNGGIILKIASLFMVIDSAMALIYWQFVIFKKRINYLFKF